MWTFEPLPAQEDAIPVVQSAGSGEAPLPQPVRTSHKPHSVSQLLHEVWALDKNWITRLRLPRGTRLVVAGALFLLVLVAAAWGALDRRNVVSQWPKMTAVYERMGLAIRQPGDGIDFRDVKSELVYDGGILRLTVEGNLVNTTKFEQVVPHILADAKSADGGTIQSWRIDSPVATLPPLARATFRSTINAPRDGVAHVNLNFVGRKNAED